MRFVFCFVVLFGLVSCEILRLLDGHNSGGDGGPPSKRCIRTCSGNTGSGTTTWTASTGSHIGAYTDIDMTGCSFIKVPNVVSNLNGKSYMWYSQGHTACYSLTTTSCRVFTYAHQDYETVELAEKQGWYISWIAVGEADCHN